MNNQVIPISIEEADLFAREYFINIGGLNQEGPKYKRLLDMGMTMKERVKDHVDIKAIVSSFQKEQISGNTINLNGITFVCNAFERINRDSIQEIYAYILTAGIFELEDEESFLNQLYADIWGTAYVDAGLEVLKNKLKSNSLDINKNIISNVLDNFGPGFYGMDVTQIGNFFKILDGEKIGVQVRKNSLMLPLKSCAGFFVVVDDETKLPPSDCKSCYADHKGCEFCQAVIKGNK